MRIHKLSVQNFRGIKSLHWDLPSKVCCLVGPGDSRKSSILCAINYALHPQHELQLNDFDLHNCDSSNPVLIEVTISDLPDALLSESKYGLYLRGITPQGDLIDEPINGSLPVLTIRFQLTGHLEPEWRVVKDSVPQGKEIGSGDRASFGAMWIDDSADDFFSWRKGYPLSRLADCSSDISRLLVETHRTAAKSINDESLPSASTAKERTTQISRRIGVEISENLCIGLDYGRTGKGFGYICLQDERVPLRCAGLGTKRLLALGLQQEAFPEGALVLIDEIERGLEPHRLRHLLSYFQRVVEKPKDVNPLGQVILTSHHPIAIAELGAKHICIVRESAGVINIKNVPDSLQGVIRGQPEGILAKSIIVCEGATEVGLLRAFSNYWQHTEDLPPVSAFATAFVDGRGSSLVENATNLKALGFRVSTFNDSDVDLKTALTSAGFAESDVFCWSDSVSTEERIVGDIPINLLKKVVSLAIEYHDSGEILDSVWSRANGQGTAPSTIDQLFDGRITEQSLRIGFSSGAKKKGWFKRVDRSESLGNLLIDNLKLIERTPLVALLDQVKQWVYASAAS